MAGAAGRDGPGRGPPRRVGRGTLAAALVAAVVAAVLVQRLSGLSTVPAMALALVVGVGVTFGVVVAATVLRGD
jgi:hypothetical protein